MHKYEKLWHRKREPLRQRTSIELSSLSMLERTNIPKIMAKYPFKT